MDLHTVILSGFGGALKCFVCENYLSYFPISVCSNNRSICGRCVLPAGLSSLQDIAYQTVVQFLKFPCRYKSEGCFEELQPKDVPQHEKNCPLRIIKCILDYPRRCQWSGSLPTLTDHCQKEHSDIFLKSDEFEMNLTQVPVTNQHLMEVDDKLFIFVKQFDLESKILTCAVYPNEYVTNVESYSCQLSIRSGKTTISHEFETTGFAENIFEDVCLQFARKETDQDSVTVNISLVKKEAANELENHAKNSNLREFLRCSGCRTIAGPAIFRDTVSMAVLCALCHSRCAPTPAKTEDKILSSFAAAVTYPCKYHTLGCTYRAYLEELKAHHDACQYRKENCLYLYSGCERTVRKKDAESHLLEQHAHKIMSLEKKITISKRKPSRRSRIVRFSNRLFHLDYYVRTDGRLLCSVKKISVCKENFSFEVEVYDTAEPGSSRRHVMTAKCEHWCIFTKEQVFGRAASTKFKVRIFKTA